MKKKLFVWVMALVMVLSSMSVVAFADDNSGEKTYPNYNAIIYVENEDCVHKDKLDVKIELTAGNTEALLTLKYDPDLDAYVDEGYMTAIDAEILKAVPELTAKIVVDDGDATHEIYNDSDMLAATIVHTKDEIKAEADATMNYIMYWVYEMVKDDPEALAEVEKILGGTLSVDDNENLLIDGRVLGMQDMIDISKRNAEELGLDEEALAEIEAYEKMMASDAFLGQVEITETIKCNCPDIVDYNLYHEYYDGNGDYVAQEYIDSRDAAGTVIKVADIPLKEEYDGVKYTFKGAYLYDEKKDGWDYDNPLTEFTVAENMEVGLVYETDEVLFGDGDGNGNGGADGNDDGDRNDGVAEDVDGTVDTGDDFNMLPFVALMVLAAGGAVAAVIRRRV